MAPSEVAEAETQHRVGAEQAATGQPIAADFGRRDQIQSVSLYLLGPGAASAVAAVFTTFELQAAILAFVATLLGAAAVHSRPPRAFFLPLMGRIASRAVGPAIGIIALALYELLVHPLGLTSVELAAVFAAAVAGSSTGLALRRRRSREVQRTRIAVIGSPDATSTLAQELAEAGVFRHEVIGRIDTGEEDDRVSDPARLGPVESLEEIVRTSRIDLLVMAADAPRAEVLEEVSRSCLHLPVRFCGLSDFCERVFGHVPVTEIDASWFQHIMHPNFRARTSSPKRVLDLLIAGMAGLVVLPLLGVFALLVTRDGGPALFTQTRIGEGGRALKLYKLRTMSVSVSGIEAAAWSHVGDARVTRIGRLLRRTHLDELPQLLNVLRGEMSIVGPRPEQPEFVERLERIVPFYSRRHLVKPGITGWAQIRCGYAGSDAGSAWKVCHDLYYVKHRSMALDLLILGETVRTLLGDHQYGSELARRPSFARIRTESPYARFGINGPGVNAS